MESLENQQQVFHPSHRPWKSATTADSHIPTASTTGSLIKRSDLKPALKPLTMRVGQIKLPKWAKCSCQTQKVRKRKKKPSRKFRNAFGHTPLSIEEKIPWKCRRLVVGTGTGALPVMTDVKKEAKRRKLQLVVVPTSEAIKVLRNRPDETNAILHVTC